MRLDVQQDFGKVVARKLFENRGNRSTIHVNEREVAELIAVACEVHSAAVNDRRSGRPAAFQDACARVFYRRAMLQSRMQ